jgi:hypothetical protein
LTSNQTHLSLSTKNTSNEIDVSRSFKIFKELHKLELNKRLKYQTINLKIRFQRWQWRHQLILETTIYRDIIDLRNRIYETNFNRKRNDLITKFNDLIDMQRRIFSNDDNIREQSKHYYSDQKFSISRTNQAHRYSNSLHWRKSDRRIHRFNLRNYRSNDNWRFNKIINQRQICSISRCSKNRIITFLAKRLRDNNLLEFINFFVIMICESQIMNRFFSEN